jgi:hypothetical protein
LFLTVAAYQSVMGGEILNGGHSASISQVARHLLSVMIRRSQTPYRTLQTFMCRDIMAHTYLSPHSHRSNHIPKGECRLLLGWKLLSIGCTDYVVVHMVTHHNNWSAEKQVSIVNRVEGIVYYVLRECDFVKSLAARSNVASILSWTSKRTHTFCNPKNRPNNLWSTFF